MATVIVRTAVFTRALACSATAALLLIATACGSHSSETITRPSQVKCQIQAQSGQLTFPTDGGTGTIRVVTERECTWSARSDTPWVSLTAPVSGQGDGTVQFTVASNADPTARTGALTVEDQRLQVAQEGRRCEFKLSSTSESVDASGGDRTVQVATGSSQCHWTSASDVPWISIVSGGEQSGPGAVTLRVEPVTGPARAGSVSIAGQSVQINQGVGCTYTVATTAFSIGSAGGTIDVPVSAPAGCTWTAASDTAWISIDSGASSSGTGVATFRIAPTDGANRSGTVSVAGKTVTMTQSSGCSYQLGASSYAAPLAGGSTTVPVAAGAGCMWTASSSAEWIGITSGQTGTGPGQVGVTVAANAGQARAGAVLIAGQSFAITQGAGCTFSVAPMRVSVPAAAGSSTVQVTSTEGCAWSAATSVPWLSITSGPGGSGIGQVQFAVAANAGPAREGSLAIAGHNITVAQANGCTYTAGPAAQDVAAGGGPGSATLTTAAACPWTASTSADWISLATTAGTGPGQVSFNATPNQSPARSGKVIVAGQPLIVNQPSTCSWAMLPPTHSFTASGGNGNILVIVTGPCTWSATSDSDWITVTAGSSGAGNGLVQFVAAPNAGAARTGSLTIAGQRYEVTEGGH